MKPAPLAFLGALLVPAIAFAQPAAQRAGTPAYYTPPPPPGYAPTAGPPSAPGGFHDRAGRLALGFSFGLGKMQINDSDVPCDGCEGAPLSFTGDAHLGWMLSPRLALMLEVQGTGQVVADDGVTTETLIQSTAMVAAKYWVTPQLWLKGGIGAAQLSLTRDDGFETANSEALDGGALMGAIGYEVLSARNFSIDLHAQVTAATYEDSTINEDGSTGDGNLATTSIGVGFNWH